jgi:ectoine hydroxylase-related dioxygenase (phytanoyl-CoA dioxygenase family)
MIKLQKYLNKENFAKDLKEKGWFIAHDFIQDENFIGDVKSALRECSRNCRQIQIKNGVAENTDGTTHHLIGQDKVFLELLKNLVSEFNELLEDYFSSKYILNTCSGNFLEFGTRSYSHEIHRDVRTYSADVNLMINALVMLDDFTEDNGATYLLSGSHLHKEKPSKEEFYAKADRAIAKRGSVLFWHSNLWHAAGDNKTNQERTSVAPMFSKPFMKQQFDYINAVGINNILQLDENLQQVLGYFSRVPSTLDEWYQPKEKRCYRSNQEI